MLALGWPRPTTRLWWEALRQAVRQICLTGAGGIRRTAARGDNKTRPSPWNDAPEPFCLRGFRCALVCVRPALPCPTVTPRPSFFCDTDASSVFCLRTTLPRERTYSVLMKCFVSQGMVGDARPPWTPPLFCSLASWTCTHPFPTRGSRRFRLFFSLRGERASSSVCVRVLPRIRMSTRKIFFALT